MTTFLLDLHGGLAAFGPAAPLLYPLRESGELDIVATAVTAEAGDRISALADAVRIRLLRSFATGWLALFLVDLPGGRSRRPGLAQQLEQIRSGFLDPLAAHGMRPARVFVVSLDAVARSPHTGEPLDSDARAHWQDDAQHLGRDAPAALADVTVVRFPLRETPQPLFQQDLVRLVYLLLALVETGSDDQVLPTGQLLQAHEVALDEAEVTRWMADYLECLREAERAVVHRLEYLEPMTLRLIADANCGCGHALPPAELSAQGFGWFRHPDDMHRWLRWGERTGASLTEREHEGTRMLRQCTEERRRREFLPVAKTVKSLDEEAVRLRSKLEAARDALLTDSPPPAPSRDWEHELRRQTPYAFALIDARPRPRSFAISFVALLMLLLTPALLTLRDEGASHMLATALLLLAGCVAAAALAMARQRDELRDAADAALEAARSTAARTADQVERRRRRLERLCEAEAARLDCAETDAALATQAREVLLLKHHRAALQHHVRLASAVQAAVGPGSGPQSPAPVPSSAARAPARDWPLERPPERHFTYAPARCGGAPIEARYELQIGARRLEWSSSLARGLRHIRLVQDPIYRTFGRDEPATSGSG